MQQYIDSVQQYLGAPCEVLHLDNRFLFAGSIRDYNDANEELTIAVRNTTTTPQGIIYHTPVKLHVSSQLSTSNVVLLYGLVTRCAADFWKITLKHTFFCAERRSSFRQPISVQALVYRMDSDQSSAPIPCDMIDISLTGLCFRSQETYLQGEKITVSGLQLSKNGPIHTFQCTVQRSQPIADSHPAKIRYGCSFDKITERQEDRLFQDMFSLQIKAFNRK